MRFKEKVCLVTGSGSGIGKAVATQLANEGGRIVVVDMDERHGSAIVGELSAAGHKAIFAQCNEEAADRKIRVNCVAPGAVGKPEDIAAAVCFLASAEARFITGTTLVADGGRLDIL